MGKRDLRGDARIVSGDVRVEIAHAVLELDVHSCAELLDVESRGLPVDADLLTDLAGLLRGECLPLCHRSPSFSRVRRGRAGDGRVAWPAVRPVAGGCGNARPGSVR